uniref:Uncharacterized protein n=1 Tax=Arundo donax TaxID=35708 RepID=A0A0A8YHL4_ARUDO
MLVLSFGVSLCSWTYPVLNLGCAFKLPRCLLLLC